jgi:hypothetical protein
MNDTPKEAWGERLAAEGAAAGTDQPSLRRLFGDAVGVVKGRLGEVSKAGIRPLLDEAAAQVRPATLQELRARYPDLPDDEVARRLIDRAAKTAAGLAMLVGGVVAAQEAMAAASAAAPPVAGTAIGSIGVTALAEVLALFVLEAKLRADLGAAARRAAARLTAMVPARFARIVIPEIVAPLIGSAVAARLASRQVRAGGEQHWGRLRTAPRTTASWGSPVTPNGGRPPAGRHPSGWGPPPGDEPRQLPPPQR